MNSKHETLLHQESYSGNFEAIQLLLEHGANINVRNEKGQTPIHKTLLEMNDDFEDRFFDSIRFLLEHGADVDAPDNDKSNSAACRITIWQCQSYTATARAWRKFPSPESRGNDCLRSCVSGGS